MANNKRRNLDVGNFINEVKADSTSSQRLSTFEEEEEVVQPAPQPKPVGRPPRSKSMLSKQQAKLVYIDDETEMRLRLIKTFQEYDYKEVIFTAVHEFLDKHYQQQDMRLDESGMKKVEKVIKEYKTRK